MITKTTLNIAEKDFENGESILIDKPLNWSSFDVVCKIRNTIGKIKVGHAGTLDPKATGLLILCTGKMTKSINEFQGLSKTYFGSFTLGKKSISMDTETDIIEEKSFNTITDEKIEEARLNFIGDILQTPPMYSAINYKGKKLYQYARKGKSVDISARLVTINEFEILKIDKPEIYFKIKCSKGTYIRAIANDYGTKLGCGAILSSLRRTEIGNYSVEDALKVEDFCNEFSTKKNNINLNRQTLFNNNINAFA